MNDDQDDVLRRELDEYAGTVYAQHLLLQMFLDVIHGVDRGRTMATVLRKIEDFSESFKGNYGAGANNPRVETGFRKTLEEFRRSVINRPSD